MKFLIVLCAAVAVSSAQFRGFGQAYKPVPAPARPAAPVAARSAASDAAAETLRLDSDISPDGSYSYAFETNNGIAAQAQGTPRDFGGNPQVIADVAQGSYSWTSPEGQVVSISYVADENGYQPQGDALPTPPAPPAIPPQIARALDYIAKHAPKQ